MTMTRRRLLDDTFKKTVVGNPAIATDSLARMYPGITMQGWTDQDGTPTPENPVPIVSAGTKNQENGKWEYEITITNAQTDPDKNQTVTLTADRPLTKWDRLEKRGGQWGWVYGSAESDMSSEVTWNIHQGYELETSNLFRGVMSGVDKIDSTDVLLCNILPYYQAAFADVINGIYSMSNNLFARIVGIKSLEDFQEKIQGGKVLTKLSTETFVSLTTAEQEAMNALYTYRPTTVLSNQQDCEMALTYKTRKGVGGGNLLDFENITFVRCYPVSQYSIMCNIENSYMSSIDIYYLNDLISESKGKKLVFSFTGNPSGRLGSIVLHGTYSDGSVVKEANNYGDNPVELIIPDTLESVSRLEVRVNRNATPFTDTTTIISNLNLRLED